MDHLWQKTCPQVSSLEHCHIRQVSLFFIKINKNAHSKEGNLLIEKSYVYQEYVTVTYIICKYYLFHILHTVSDSLVIIFGSFCPPVQVYEGQNGVGSNLSWKYIELNIAVCHNLFQNSCNSYIPIRASTMNDCDYSQMYLMIGVSSLEGLSHVCW